MNVQFQQFFVKNFNDRKAVAIHKKIAIQIVFFETQKCIVLYKKIPNHVREAQ
jgi:hypothetical protein